MVVEFTHATSISEFLHTYLVCVHGYMDICFFVEEREIERERKRESVCMCAYSYAYMCVLCVCMCVCCCCRVTDVR